MPRSGSAPPPQSASGSSQSSAPPGSACGSSRIRKRCRATVCSTPNNSALLPAPLGPWTAVHAPSGRSTSTSCRLPARRPRRRRTVRRAVRSPRGSRLAGRRGPGSPPPRPSSSSARVRATSSVGPGDQVAAVQPVAAGHEGVDHAACLGRPAAPRRRRPRATGAAPRRRRSARPRRRPGRPRPTPSAARRADAGTSARSSRGCCRRARCAGTGNRSRRSTPAVRDARADRDRPPIQRGARAARGGEGLVEARQMHDRELRHCRRAPAPARPRTSAGRGRSSRCRRAGRRTNAARRRRRRARRSLRPAPRRPGRTARRPSSRNSSLARSAAVTRSRRSLFEPTSSAASRPKRSSRIAPAPLRELDRALEVRCSAPRLLLEQRSRARPCGAS